MYLCLKWDVATRIKLVRAGGNHIVSIGHSVRRMLMNVRDGFLVNVSTLTNTFTYQAMNRRKKTVAWNKAKKENVCAKIISSGRQLRAYD